MIQSYYDPNLFKTDCPPQKIYQLFQCYKKTNYEEKDYLKNVNEKSYSYKILTKQIGIQPKFYEVETVRNIPRYLPNPFPNWGPKAKTKLTKYFFSTLRKIIKN